MMMKIALYTVAALVVVGLVVTIIGSALPQDHVASVRRTVEPSPAQVFARISDVARYPDWRTEIQAVEVLSASPLKWRERSGDDVVTYEVVESRPPERLVIRIADPNLPFGGTWTYELESEGTGTRVAITERGEVYNPIFRVMSRFVFGHTGTMEKVLKALDS